MDRVDDELVARALRWCADAGRQTSPEQVRAALERLGWDELLAARALLADPPPARPLGPWALADLARGALPEVAAEREREGRYASAARAVAVPAREAPPQATSAAATSARGAAPVPVSARPTSAARRGRRGSAAGPRIRRAADRVEATPPPRPPPRLDELFESEGRAVLERLIRLHGARRGPVLAALVAGWRRSDGSEPGDDDLAALLDAHGLTRGFERRERDELLHALRVSGGSIARAASAAGLSADAFRAALERLRAAPEAEAIRDARRDELRRRPTLSDRARLLLAERDRLEDLGILAEIEDDLRRRLPEHVRALRLTPAGPLAAALARSLAVAPRELTLLAARLGLALDPAPPRAARSAPAPAPSRRPAATSPPRHPRSGPARPGRPGSAPRGKPPRGNPRRGDGGGGRGRR
jgi:hypothetical protein